MTQDDASHLGLLYWLVGLRFSPLKMLAFLDHSYRSSSTSTHREALKTSG